MAIVPDPAASELYEEDTKTYNLRKEGKKLTDEQMVEFWTKWVTDYPIVSIEDAFAQDDWASWQLMTSQLGNKLQIVGDDLLVTNPERVRKAIKDNAANALLVKVNQIGSLTETIEAVETCHCAPLASGHFASLRRNGRRDHRRPCRGVEQRSDQDRCTCTFRPCGEVQPVDPHRRCAWRYCQVCWLGCVESITKLKIKATELTEILENKASMDSVFSVANHLSNLVCVLFCKQCRLPTRVPEQDCLILFEKSLANQVDHPCRGTTRINRSSKRPSCFANNLTASRSASVNVRHSLLWQFSFARTSARVNSIRSSNFSLPSEAKCRHALSANLLVHQY